MSRPFVLAGNGFACALVGWLVVSGSSGVAQPAVEARIALAVHASSSEAERCFQVDALRRRIAHYGRDRLAGAAELRLELTADAPGGAELRVYRGTELVASRHFDRLPEACADRRDAVALSIALALEGVIRTLQPNDRPTTSVSEEVLSAGRAAAPVSARGTVESGRQRRDASESSARQSSPIERVVVPQPRATDVPGTVDAPEPTGAGRAIEPEAAEALEPATPEREVAVPAEPAADGGRGGGPSVALHAGGRWLAHALPAPVWTGVLGAALWTDRTLSFELSAIASTVGRSSFLDGRLRTRLIGGELLGCYAVEQHGFAAQGCAGAVAAACQARGRGYPVPFPAATLLWAAGTARLALLWAHHELVSLRLLIQAHLNLVRPELRVAGSTEQLEPFWLGGAGGLDLVVSFD